MVTREDALMSQTCPHCSSSSASELKQKTILGYGVFGCGCFDRKFNERTGTPFNFLEFPTDVVLLVVRWRLRYKLSLRDLGEMFLDRGLEFTHEAVRVWEARFAPMVSDALRQRRRGSLGVSWYVDETYVKVSGKWCYLYRAIERDGNLVDCRLSETRDNGRLRSGASGVGEAGESCMSPETRVGTFWPSSSPMLRSRMQERFQDSLTRCRIRWSASLRMVGTTGVRSTLRLDNEVSERSSHRGEMRSSRGNLTCATEMRTSSESKRLGVVVASGGWTAPSIQGREYVLSVQEALRWSIDR